MAQDVGPEGVGPQPTGSSDGRRTTSPWPWIALAILVLIVIVLLWSYWRKPADGNVTVTKTTVTEIPLTSPEPRPEPVVPTVVAEPAETTSAAPSVLGETGSGAVRSPQPVGDVTMPNVMGLTESAAKSKVRAAGLTPYITYGQVAADRPNGRVMSQYPLPGDSVPRGSQGLIQVAFKP
jgi:hypothetical protein